MLRHILCAALLLITASVNGMAGKGPSFELLSRTLMQGPSRTATFFKDRLLLGTGGGIAVLSYTDTLTVSAFLPVNGEPHDIVVRGNTAYIAADRGGLITVDLSDPRNPKEVNNYRTRQAVSCSIYGNYIFLADLRGRLYTFELTNPLEPELKSTKTLSPTPVAITSEDDLLAIIDRQNAKIFRIQENGTLKGLYEISSPNEIKKGLLEERILYLLSSEGEISRWNLSDPGKPDSIPPIPVKRAIDLAVEGTDGLVLTKSREIVPFESASENGGVANNPVKTLKKLNARGRGGRFKGSSIILYGRRLATIAGKSGLFLYDIEGRNAHLLGNIPTGGFAVDLVSSGDLLYVANSGDGMRIGRVHKDGSIDWIGHTPTTEARDLAVIGTTVILADGRDGIKIIDASDPRSPRIIGKHSSPFFESAIVTGGQYAYVAGGLGGVEVFDIKNPKRPRLTWREEFSEVRGIHVDDDFLYFADGYDGFRIFSIEGGKPSDVSLLNTPGWNCDLFVIENTAYLADGGRGIRVVDISDRKNPKELGSVDLGTIARELHAVNGTVFIAAHTSGIAAIDVSDPYSPYIAARFPTVDDGRGVFADKRFVYLASGSGGVYIFKYRR